jgi:hypothetical protein
MEPSPLSEVIMNLNSTSPIASRPVTNAQGVTRTAFEQNSAQFGPVAASAIGAAQALGEVASATVSWSEDALSQAGQGLVDAEQAVEGQLMAWAHGVQEGLDELVDAGEAACDEVIDEGKALGQGIGQVATSLYETVGQWGKDAASAVSSGVQAVRSLL